MAKLGAAILALALSGGAFAQQSEREKAQDKKLFQSAQKGNKAALQQLRTRAEAGDAYAQGDMGLIYEVGSLVAKDYGQAAQWFRKAAEQGDAFAQGSLGERFPGGRGVSEDLVIAYIWFNIAAANGDRASVIFREHIEKVMASEQIAEAQRLSRDGDQPGDLITIWFSGLRQSHRTA